MEEYIFETMTLTEVNQRLTGKFLRVRHLDNDYCFRVLIIRDICRNDTWDCRIKKSTGFTIIQRKKRDNLEETPVFDFRRNGDSADIPRESLIVYADVLANGLISHIGIIIDDFNELLDNAMSEMGFDLLYEAR